MMLLIKSLLHIYEDGTIMNQCPGHWWHHAREYYISVEEYGAIEVRMDVSISVFIEEQVRWKRCTYTCRNAPPDTMYQNLYFSRMLRSIREWKISLKQARIAEYSK